MMEGAGLAPLSEEEFLADVTYSTAEEFFSSLMDIAAPFQNLFATLTAEQKMEAERGIMDRREWISPPRPIVLPIAARSSRHANLSASQEIHPAGSSATGWIVSHTSPLSSLSFLHFPLARSVVPFTSPLPAPWQPWYHCPSSPLSSPSFRPSSPRYRPSSPPWPFPSWPWSRRPLQ